MSLHVLLVRRKRFTSVFKFYSFWDKFVHTRDRDVSIGFRSVTLLLFRALADGGGVHTGAGAVGRGRDAAA